MSDSHEKWKAGGKQALKRSGQPGRLAKVSETELAEVARALEKGPRANGFATELWTLAGVADVIEKVTRVTYHPGHVWRVLLQMGWSRQKPARRAVERNDEAIEQWINERWPKVKKKLGPGVRGSSSQTKAGSGSPLGEVDQGSDARRDASFQLEASVDVGRQPGPYNDEPIMEFLSERHRHLDGDKVTSIWDGLPSHRRRAMQAFLRKQRRWLVVERLPDYAPDLNPVEQVWGNLKGVELANLCLDTIDEAEEIADQGLCRIGNDTTLAFSFLRHCGLDQ